MNIPRSVKTALQSLPEDAQRDYKRDFNRRGKSLFTAYVAWLLLGWHYLYLGRIGMQFAFWFTAGFLVVGWFIDFFRLPGMVGRLNEDRARELMSEYKMMHQSSASPVVHTIIQQAPPIPQQPRTISPRPPQPPVSNSKYFCYLNNEVQGPFEFSTLTSLYSQNQISDETQCCLEGSEEWISYNNIKA